MLISATTSDPVVQLLTQGGSIGILAFIVIAFLRGWIVPGSEAKQLRDERDRALELVYDQASLTHKMAEVAEARLRIEERFLDRRTGRDDQ